jgi:hypothetical protein
MLSVSNGSSFWTSFLVDSFEESAGDNWNRCPLTNAAGLTTQGLNWLVGFRGWKQFLEPGRSFTTCVPLPTTNASWRVRFICQERANGDGWRTLWGTATPTSTVFLVNANRNFSRYQVFSGTRYSIVSPEVSR